MENLSIEMVIEKNLSSSDNAMLVALEIDVIDPNSQVVIEVLRVVRNNEEITWNNKFFAPADFDLEMKHAAGELPSVTIGIKDYTLAVQQKMQDYGGGVGFTVRVIVINSGNLMGPPELIETFKVTGASAADYIVNWTLGALDPSRLRFPRRTQWTDRCSWQFKSEDCAYKGLDSSCDLTLQGPNGCGKKGNERNFGGCPGLIPR